jgi:hypothetical protein
MPRRSTTNASAEQADHPPKGDHERFIASWLDQVRRDPDLPGNAFKVAYEIAIHLNRKTREAWPSQHTICTNTALGETCIKEMIARLKKRGHLQVQSGDGRGRSSHYRLTLKTGREHDPFTDTERGRDQDQNEAKGVAFDQERGGDRAPDLMTTWGDAYASPQGEKETCAHAHDGLPLVAASPDGAATEEEEPSSHAPSSLPKEEGFSELRRVWARPWIDADDANAMKLYFDSVQEVAPDVILEAAKAWVAAADAPRFLPPLSKWLGWRGWEKSPPQKRTQPARAPHQSHQRRGKADLGRMMLAMGED